MELVQRLRSYLPKGDGSLWSQPSKDTTLAADLIEKQAEELAAARAELEVERMRLAACGVVAMSNTPESAAKAREMLPEYRSGSLDDVIRAVDSEMDLRDQLAAEQAKNVGLREALDNHSGNYKLSKEECAKINALLDPPSDTSELEAYVIKAGEKMQEKCCVALRRLDYRYSALAIRALPCVTLEDLK